MPKQTKYGKRTFEEEFPDDQTCLEHIFKSLHSYKCSCGGRYSLIARRRQFQCSKCRFQIAPTASTIFHKSSTPLTLWFHAIHVFSNAKSGISALQMQRDLEVTYKTAWRILHLIRKALGQPKRKLRGDVEMDSAFFGGRQTAGKRNRGMNEAMSKKSIIMAAVERGGKLRAEVVPNDMADTHGDFISRTMDKDKVRLLTDMEGAYRSIMYGRRHEAVNHSKKEWVRGDVHINTIEAFWSHVKRSLKGIHKAISKQHLQTYLDGFVFHYNNRHSDRKRFEVLLETLLFA